MIESDSSHFQVVEGSLKNERSVDEQTFSCLSVLQERLERLKASSDMFGDIDFSPDVKELMRRKKESLVC